MKKKKEYDRQKIAVHMLYCLMSYLMTIGIIAITAIVFNILTAWVYVDIVATILYFMGSLTFAILTIVNIIFFSINAIKLYRITQNEYKIPKEGK